MHLIRSGIESKQVTIILDLIVLFQLLNVYKIALGDLTCESDLAPILEFPPNDIVFSVDERPQFLVSLSRNVLDYYFIHNCVQRTLLLRVTDQHSNVQYTIEKPLNSNATADGENTERFTLEVIFSSLEPGNYLFQAYAFQSSKSSAEQEFLIASNSAFQFAELSFNISLPSAPNTEHDAVHHRSSVHLPNSSLTPPLQPTDRRADPSLPAIYIDFPPHGHGASSRLLILQRTKGHY
jgi:hypothetical protein